MIRYDYYTEVYDDVKDYYFENKEVYKGLDRDDLIEKLTNDCFIADSVTGNASGSYTFSRYEAEGNLRHNTDLLADACKELGSNPATLLLDPEAADVTIRCYLIGQVVPDVVDDIISDIDDADTEED